jgi:hypothetical protein
MERTITIKETSGTDHKQPPVSPQNVAAQGQKGDTQLAHVNPWEQALLKALGGAGTTNPNTGLKQFYTGFSPFDRGNPNLDTRRDARQAIRDLRPGIIDRNLMGTFPSMDSIRTPRVSNPNPAWTGGQHVRSTPYTPHAVMGPGIVNSLSGGNSGYTPVTPTPVGSSVNNAMNLVGSVLASAPSQDSLEQYGRYGDTDVALTDSQDRRMLRRMGGAGTVNPVTGLREYYTPGGNFTNPIDVWYRESFGREADPEGLAYWTEQDKGNMTDDELFKQFIKYGNNEVYSGWTPTVSTPTPAVTDTTVNQFPSIYSDPNDPTSGPNLDWAPTTTSDSTTVSGGTSYAGLPGGYGQDLLKSLMPQLNSAITNMPGNIDAYTQQALSQYLTGMDNALRINVPKAVNNMANRGIMSSTAGNEVMSNVLSSAQRDASTKGYETAMQAALLKANMPTVLAQIAELGKIQTQGNTSTSTSTGTTTDPTKLVQMYLNMLNGSQ